MCLGANNPGDASDCFYMAPQDDCALNGGRHYRSAKADRDSLLCRPVAHALLRQQPASHRGHVVQAAVTCAALISASYRFALQFRLTDTDVGRAVTFNPHLCLSKRTDCGASASSPSCISGLRTAAARTVSFRPVPTGATALLLGRGLGATYPRRLGQRAAYNVQKIVWHSPTLLPSPTTQHNTQRCSASQPSSPSLPSQLRSSQPTSLVTGRLSDPIPGRWAIRKSVVALPCTSARRPRSDHRAPRHLDDAPP